MLLAMVNKPLDRRSVPLEADAPVPIDQPFTAAMAAECGVSRRQLDCWQANGVLRHPIRGVYYSAGLQDTLELRLAVLKLVVPPACVVTDRTAGWLLGADMILAPNDHLVVPRVHVFCPPGHRLRNGLTNSGERQFGPGDIVDLDGIRLTTPLRTACDLGRLLHRDQALAAMDSLARLGAFTLSQLLVATSRYRRYRGVVQLRALAPYVDPGAESPPESILRLRWLDLGLPRPRCQVPVPSPYGGTWWLDVGVEEHRFAAEYDGEQFHADADKEHDEQRRSWLRRTGEWTIVVVRKANLFGANRDVDQLLLDGARSAGLT